MLFLVLRAYCQLLQFDSYLVRGDFAALHRKVKSHPTKHNVVSCGAMERVTSAMNTACIWYWKQVLCLQKSAATACLLKDYGVRAELVIGTRTLPFQAHAWVEVNGCIVNERKSDLSAYAVLDRC